MIEFFKHDFFVVFGGLMATITLFAFAWGVYLFFKGILPVTLRFGSALAKRKVAIIGNADAQKLIKATLVSSKIFSAKNLYTCSPKDMEDIPLGAVVIVDWESCQDDFYHVQEFRANAQMPIIIFAKPASIPPELLGAVANAPNTVVVNFRGRLLNDVLTAMMTSSLTNT